MIDASQARMDMAPQAMRIRRRLVEHPFGTIKAWMGHTHFLTKRLPNVKTEISLHILASNMKRVMALLGTQTLIEAMRPKELAISASPPAEPPPQLRVFLHGLDS